MNDLDFDYLKLVGKSIPAATGARWGCAFDGQRLALVGYAICETGRRIPVKGRPLHSQAETGPKIFYAGEVSGVSISRAVLLFDRIAQACGLIGLTLRMEGAGGRNEVFYRHLKNENRHAVAQFKASQGKYFEIADVLMAIRDDQATGLISLAPEFEGRPERVMLDEEVAAIDLDRKLTMLQSAFVYGLGHWSCLDQRARYAVGSVPGFRLY
jgi:hypothetical protein